MSTIGGDELTRSVIVHGTEAGLKVTAALSRLTVSSMKAALDAGTWAIAKTPLGRQHRDHGKMDLKSLQKLTGGDLHSQEVSPDLLRTLQRDLKRRGVDFAIEKAPDGGFYVHFKGADVDTLKHAFTQAQARLDQASPRHGQTRDDQPTQKPVPEQKEQRSQHAPSKQKDATPTEAPTAEPGLAKQSLEHFHKVGLSSQSELAGKKTVPQTRADVKQTIQARAQEAQEKISRARTPEVQVPKVGKSR